MERGHEVRLPWPKAVGGVCLLKGQGTQVTGQASRLQHSCLSLIIQRHGIRHGRLRGLVWQILKTSSCLFVGVKVFLGGPEKAGCWSHPGVAGRFTPILDLWCGTVWCLLDLAKYC